MRNVLAEARYLISVAIERQQDAPDGIDVIAYELLRTVQGKLGDAAGMVPGERPVTGREVVPRETPVVSSGGAS